MDYENNGGTLWIFATPNDRCGHPLHHAGSKWVQSWHTSAADLGDTSAWSTAVAGGTQGYGNGANVGVGRVILTSAEFSRRGLPPHKAIMIAEDTTIRLNNQPHGDLTRGWIKTKYKIEGPLAPTVPPIYNRPRQIGCPSVRFGTDGYFYFVTGMGKWNGIARSKDLVEWTFGEGTCEGGKPCLSAAGAWEVTSAVRLESSARLFNLKFFNKGN